ncbi:hypothetical protein [Phenylobacterium sp.]|uniref:hypothetical protein n=1 Tax=Phenylobacterium sp. TaxID=1871053 RepID=UPI002C789416|nr:hypothetical protein [Phenylobacterium sp.]HVI31133.1 hypothetical protein [Phenylobacterium sp.]
MLPAIALHIAGGALGILSGFWALAVRKGGDAHRLAGRVFFAAMLAMAGFALVVAALRVQKLNAIAAAFTLYLVVTAWTAVRRPAATPSRLEPWAALWAVAVSAAGFGIGGLIASTPGGLADGDPTSGLDPAIYYAFGVLAAFAALMDVRVIRRGGLAGPARTSRHLWRMCLALFIAAGSFFFGQADEVPAALRGPHLAVPPFAALGALAFWMLKVRLPRRRRPVAAAAA